MLEGDIDNFISWIHTMNRTSYNTEVSYRGDLQKMAAFFDAGGKSDTASITSEDLERYLDYLKREEFAPTTISRNIASIHAFFHYLCREGRVETDPSGNLQAPKAEKRKAEPLRREEIEKLLSQPSEETAKGIRDRAMLELLTGTGMKVSELVHLKVSDVNLERACICCNEAGHERVLKLSEGCSRSLNAYLGKVRESFIKKEGENALFTSCLGLPMSRQGIWKILKVYAKEAGITEQITPQSLRRTFADQMLQSGADYRQVQEMLGNNAV